MDPNVLDTKWTPAGDPKKADSYFVQLRAGEDAIVGLLKNWGEATVASSGGLDGDAVRRIVGTVGVGSPLFGIEKVLRTVGDDLDSREVVDLIEFTEQTDVFVRDLQDVDAMAYSAIFSDPSGNFGKSEQSSAAYLEKSRKAAERALASYRELLRPAGVLK